MFSILSLSEPSSGLHYRVRQIMALIKTVSKTKCPLFYIRSIKQFNSDIFCAGPKPGHGFQTLYVVGFFCVQCLKMRGDCLLCWYLFLRFWYLILDLFWVWYFWFFIWFFYIKYTYIVGKQNVCTSYRNR